ncbi:MAG: adenylate/guanylate cyclase domain-containing protein, partial [Bacteroidota bacterium]
QTSTHQQVVGKITFAPDNQETEIFKNESILACSLRAGIPHYHACGGKGKCSTCRVFVEHGLHNCSQRNALESAMAQHLGFPPHLRLACQTKNVHGEVVLKRPVLDHIDLKIIMSANSRDFSKSIGQEQNVAVVFTDMVGFTSFSAGIPYYDVAHLLNRYFHQMGEVVFEHHGQIIDYYGDGFLSVFRGNKKGCCPALIATKAALAMQETMFQLNKYFMLLYGKIVRIRCGIAYGQAILGWLGAHKAEKYAVVGEVVNTASRIEQYNKKLGTHLLVSDTVFEKIKDYAITGKVEKGVSLRGLDKDYTLYEVLKLKDLK